jgi:aminoglycoside 6'-N-acetyltransferase I
MHTIKLLHQGDEEILANVAPDVFDFPIYKHFAKEFLADPRHHLAVAIEKDVIVAMASAVHYVHPDKPPQLWINEVAVAPAHQNRGIARAMLNALTELARELHCTEAWVLTDRHKRARCAFTGQSEASRAIR